MQKCGIAKPLVEVLIAGGSTLPGFLVSKEKVNEGVLRVKVNWMPLLVILLQNSRHLATLESSVADILVEKSED